MHITPVFPSSEKNNVNAYIKVLESQGRRVADHVCALYVFGYYGHPSCGKWRTSIISALNDMWDLHIGNMRRKPSTDVIERALLSVSFLTAPMVLNRLRLLLEKKPDILTRFRTDRKALAELSVVIADSGRELVADVAPRIGLPLDEDPDMMDVVLSRLADPVLAAAVQVIDPQG